MDNYYNLLTPEDKAVLQKWKEELEYQLWYGETIPVVSKDSDFLKFALVNSGEGNSNIAYVDIRDTNKVYQFTQSDSDTANPVPLEGFTFVRWATGHDL